VEPRRPQPLVIVINQQHANKTLQKSRHIEFFPGLWHLKDCGEIVDPLDVICPQCGEEKGNPCRNSHTFHKARVEAAEEATEDTTPGSEDPHQSAERLARESTESRLESRRRKRIA
jgi:hypothetical protein